MGLRSRKLHRRGKLILGHELVIVGLREHRAEYGAALQLWSPIERRGKWLAVGHSRSATVHVLPMRRQLMNNPLHFCTVPALTCMTP